jgi:hypothetical protein
VLLVLVLVVHKPMCSMTMQRQNALHGQSTFGAITQFYCAVKRNVCLRRSVAFKHKVPGSNHLSLDIQTHLSHLRTIIEMAEQTRLHIWLNLPDNQGQFM